MLLKKATRKTSNPPVKNLFETAVWRTLKAMLQKGFRLFYERDRFPYTLKRRYTPDFIIERPDGTVTYIEAKGYLRPSDRAKLLAVLRDNPDIDLRILFKQNHTLSKGSRNRYSDWATKHNIPFAIGEVPNHWISNKKKG